MPHEYQLLAPTNHSVRILADLQPQYGASLWHIRALLRLPIPEMNQEAKMPSVSAFKFQGQPQTASIAFFGKLGWNQPPYQFLLLIV
jgi:hypothetical protein